MKEGDLVKFVGDANFYKGRIGVVCRLYSIHGIKRNGVEKPDSALVYYAGAENDGRAARDSMTRNEYRRHGTSGLHPMALAELEVITR